MKGHGGATLDVSELVHASSCICISVEELSGGCFILWEISVGSTLVPLLVVVDNVVTLWLEKLVELWVGEDGIEDENLVNGWLSALISNSSESSHGEETEVDLPEKSLRNHHEGEAGVCDEASGPSVIRSMESATNLVEVIRQSHFPLPVVGLEDIVAVSELSWVSLSLLWFETGGSSNISIEIKVVAIDGLGRLESLIVISWVSSLSSASFSWGLVMVIMGSCSEASSLGTANKRSLSHHSSS